MKQNVFTKVLQVIGSSLALVVAFTGITYAAKLHYEGKSSPHFFLTSTLSIGGNSVEEIDEIIKEELANFHNTPFEIEYEGKVTRILPAAFGIQIDANDLLPQVNYVTPKITLENFIKYAFSPQKITIDVPLDRKEIEQRIRMFIPNLAIPKNAQLATDERGEIVLIHGVPGVEIEMDQVMEALERDVQDLEPGTIRLRTKIISPEVTRAAVEPHMETLKKLVDRTIIVAHEHDVWKLNMKDYINDITIHTKNGVLDYFTDQPELVLSKTIIEAYLEEEILPKVYDEPQGVKITQSEEGQIIFDGVGHNGQTADTNGLVTDLNSALNDELASTIEVPIRELPAELDVPEALAELGIKNLLASGHTTYYHSPINRRFNIDLGTKRFNGKLVPPGDVISFNEILGPVVARQGFLEELVIKNGNQLEREIGGGLCQVSTTFYRAALRAGLPIEERRPHSFPVLYYAQTDGHGLDATIYPPYQDLKMTNNTPGHLLVQSYTYKQEAFFHIYGTDDGREVELDGPYIESGTVYNGLKTSWYRYITKDGETTKERIYSSYGGIPVHEEEEDKTDEEA